MNRVVECRAVPTPLGQLRRYDCILVGRSVLRLWAVWYFPWKNIDGIVHRDRIYFHASEISKLGEKPTGLPPEGRRQLIGSRSEETYLKLVPAWELAFDEVTFDPMWQVVRLVDDVGVPAPIGAVS